MSQDTTTATNRRSGRFAISIPIVIRGKDTQQIPFSESTRTLIINRHGAKILTCQELSVGKEIVVENPAIDSVARANVVWVSSKRIPNAAHEAGIQLVEPQEIWGVEFPPDEWTTQAKAPGAAAKETSGLSAASASAKAPSPTLTSEAIATQILQDLHETADAHARQFRERLDRVVQQLGLEVEAHLREHAGAAKEREFAEIDQRISSSGEHLSALIEDVEVLDAKLAESRRSLEATLASIPPPLTAEQIHEEVEAEALPMLHQMTESEVGAARERFQAQTQADAAQALDVWKSNLEAERDALLHEARQQLSTAVTSALETLKGERDAGLNEMKHQIQEALQANEETVVLQMKSKLEAIAENHGGVLVERLNETARESGENQVSLLQGRLDALFASRLDQARQHVESVAESLQTRIEEGLHIVGDERSRELQAHLQDTADHIVAASSSQVREQVEASAKSVAEQSLQDWQAQLQDIAHKTVDASSAQIREQVEESAKATAEKNLQDWQTRLQDIAHETVDASSAQICKQVEESAKAVADEACQSWQAKLREDSIHASASSAEQIQKQMERAVSLLGPKLQEMQERAVNDAMDAFRARLSRFLGMIPASGSK
ncbi:MAG: hypothetical protein ACLQVL_15485 [Terriglobia bacterium]